MGAHHLGLFFSPTKANCESNGLGRELACLKGAAKNDDDGGGGGGGGDCEGDWCQGDGGVDGDADGDDA
eukprot:8070708-Karenia_brevis.AAC.1